MNLVIRSIDSQKVWDDFIAAAKPHTFLQSWNWGEFNEKMGQKIWRLGMYDNETLCAIAFVFKIPARRGAFLFCPHGPITSLELRVDSSELLKALTDHLKTLARVENCAFVRISPLLKEVPENNKLFHDLGYRNAPVHMMHPELACMLDVTRSEEEILKGMRQTTRYSIRRAQKDGVEVFKSTDLKDLDLFWDVYQTTVDRQNFTPFSKKYMMTELETFVKNNQAMLFFARYNGDIVSTALIVFTQDAGFYHHGASNHKYPKITASHPLQWEVILEAKRRGCTFYNFWGVAPESDRKHPWAGLSVFKRGFGGFEESYAHCKDLVISPKYWLNWIVETARRIKRGL